MPASERVAALAQPHSARRTLAVVLAALVFPSFASIDNPAEIAVQSCFLVVAALGRTFVIIGGSPYLSRLQRLRF